MPYDEDVRAIDVTADTAQSRASSPPAGAGAAALAGTTARGGGRRQAGSSGRHPGNRGAVVLAKMTFGAHRRT